MSWSVIFAGNPSRIMQALKDESGKLSGQSKVEFDAALPSLIELLGNNFAREDSGYNSPLVRLRASGSGVAKTGADGEPQQMQRTCSVSIEPFYESLLL